MKRLKLSIAFLIITTSIFISTLGHSGSDEWSNFVNKHGWSIEFPKSKWIVNGDGYKDATLARGNFSFDSKEKNSVTLLPECSVYINSQLFSNRYQRSSAKSYIASRIKAENERGELKSSLIEEKVYQIDGFEAYDATVKELVKPKNSSFVRRIAIKKGGIFELRIYENGDIKNWKCNSIFDHMIKSLRFNKGYKEDLYGSK